MKTKKQVYKEKQAEAKQALAKEKESPVGEGLTEDAPFVQ